MDYIVKNLLIMQRTIDFSHALVYHHTMRFKSIGKAFKYIAALMLFAGAVFVLTACTFVNAAFAPQDTQPAADGAALADATEALQASAVQTEEQAALLTSEPSEAPGAISQTEIPSTGPLSANTYSSDEFLSLAREEFLSLLSFDLGFDFDRSVPFAEEIASRKYALLALESCWRAELSSALDTAAANAASELGVPVPQTAFEGEVPSWQLASAVVWASGRERAASLLSSHCTAELEYDGQVLTARLYIDDFDSIISLEVNDHRFTADFVYSYFNTVFNDDFTFAEYKVPELSKSYLSTIGLPLKNMLYYDSWYGPRQNSTRHHLGMDIHAKSNADIYSCTDGTVIMMGFDDTAGYYVVVEDDSGYEYHYYHMIRLTDFVSVGERVARGQLIGSVGSTGNSDGNHLHLSIITPDHVHLNPYCVMCLLRDGGGY